MFRLIKSSLLIFVLLLSAISFAHAQGLPGIPEPITLRVSPLYPKPNSTVTVTAQSVSTDLNRATLTWISEGKTIKQGAGVTSVSVPAGKAGALTTVRVSIVTTDIGAITQETSWRPADVTLLWKTDGYVPSFYKGKALESYGSSFRVTAIPEFFNVGGVRIDPRTLIYTWKKNGTVDANQSGYGKDSFVGIQSSYVRGGDEINVQVSNNDGSIVSTKTVNINPGLPEVIFYEKSPLYGMIYEKALSNDIELSAEEITLVAEPFNISSNNLFPGINFNWNINGSAVPNFKDKPFITLRKSGVPGSQSTVALTVQHQTKILQGGQRAINIIQ